MDPRRGGVGILAETTREPALVERALCLLRSRRWHGPAQVEFKIDAMTRRPRLMEIDGRFWGTLDLPVAAGADFPWIACRIAVDGDVEAPSGYAVGLRYRWSVGFGLLATLESDRPWRTAWAFVGPERRTRSDLCLGDPLPLAAELLFVARRLWRLSLRPERGLGHRRSGGPDAV